MNFKNIRMYNLASRKHRFANSMYALSRNTRYRLAAVKFRQDNRTIDSLVYTSYYDIIKTIKIISTRHKKYVLGTKINNYYSRSMTMDELAYGYCINDYDTDDIEPDYEDEYDDDDEVDE